MKYVEAERNGKTICIDAEGYNALSINHAKQEFIATKNNCHVISLSKFHADVLAELGIGHYKDVTLNDYIDRTSDKKLKSQGLKRI